MLTYVKLITLIAAVLVQAFVLSLGFWHSPTTGLPAPSPYS